MLMAVEGEIVGVIAVADTVKEDYQSFCNVRSLRKEGIQWVGKGIAGGSSLFLLLLIIIFLFLF